MDSKLNKNSFWTEAMSLFRKKLTEEQINRFFAVLEIDSLIYRTNPSGISYYEIKLLAPTAEFTDILISKYKSLMQETFTKILMSDFNVSIDFKNDSQSDKKDTEQSSAKPKLQDQYRDYQSVVNPNFRFDTFIEGDSNRTAKNIALSVASKPGQAPQNILYIYGPSGVGKTHLCQAIGKEVERLYPDKIFCYVPYSKFEDQYSAATQSNNRNTFFRFYQSVDVLVIDDIQGLVGKNGTQKAFFEIFNHLVSLNKQIILTSDTHHSELRGLPERLETRISSSVSIEIYRPEIALRQAILKRRMAASGLNLGDEVLEFIAENANRNIRELEGAMNTIQAIASVDKSKDIDMSIAQKVLFKPSATKKEQPITMKRIHEAVSLVFEIEQDMLFQKTRKASIVLPRQVIMYIAANYSDCSLNSIANYFGLSTHSNVSHGKSNIENLIKTDIELNTKIDKVKELLNK